MEFPGTVIGPSLCIGASAVNIAFFDHPEILAAPAFGTVGAGLDTNSGGGYLADPARTDRAPDHLGDDR